jgi:hypothetical protein
MDFKVDKVLPNGELSLNGGKSRNTQQNDTIWYQNTNWKSRGTENGYRQLPVNLKQGSKEEFKFRETAVAADGTEWEQDWTGTLQVVRKERVKVPAGEFDAWRIEREANMKGTLLKGNGSPSWYGRSSTVTWYVPELHAYVARDEEFRRNAAAVPDRSRVELTSYLVNTYQPSR